MKCTMTVRKFFHFHSWKTVQDNGFTKYQECKCGSRRVFQGSGGYQPVDWNWVLGSDLSEVPRKVRTQINV